MWLEDDEIQAYLDSGNPGKISQAIEAIRTRQDAGDSLSIKPLTAEPLRAFDGEFPSGMLEYYLDFLIGQDGVPSLPEADNWHEVAKALSLYLGTHGAYDVALRIKTDDNGPALVSTILGAAQQRLADLPEKRCFVLGYFLDCLMDGEVPIREAVVAALDRWPTHPNARRAVDEIVDRLDEARQARWSK